MKRRTLLQSLVALVFVRPLSALRLRGQSQDLSAAQLETLGAIAEVVLPSSLAAGDRDLIVEQFASWVRGYREGADMGHGYGFASLRRPSGPSPARDYRRQFDALDAAARSASGASFAGLSAEARRIIIQRTLDAPQRVTRLPSQPTGENLVADFMGLYYSSPEAWDLAYGRRIGRDRCRSLGGSGERPARIASALEEDRAFRPGPVRS